MPNNIFSLLAKLSISGAFPRPVTRFLGLCAKHKTKFAALLLFVIIAGTGSNAFAQVETVGADCTVGPRASFWEQPAICPATTHLWQRPAFQFGPAVATCAAGLEGMVQWASSSLQLCGGASGWTTIATPSGTSLFLGTSTAATNPSRNGDLTTGLFSDTASTVSVATAGVQRILVTATGGVGIGTTSPANMLHLYTTSAVGQMQVQATGANSFARIWYTTDNDVQWNVGARNDSGFGGGFSFENNYSGSWVSKLFFTTSGNVGIGTTGPQAKLEVAGGDVVLINRTAGSVGTNRINPTSVGWTTLVIGSSNSSNVFNALSFGGYRIGAVNSNMGQITFHSWNTDDTLVNTIGSAIRAIAEDTNNSNFGQHLAFWTRTGTSALAEVMRITSTGNVGVGSTVPAYKLDVAGTARFTGAVTVPTPVNGTDAATKAYVDAASGGTWNSSAVTASGTWTYPTPAPSEVTVLAVGGGGAGGPITASSHYGYFACGGGGGAIVLEKDLPVSGNLTIVIGAGGNNVAGGATTVSGTGVYIRAPGGNKGGSPWYDSSLGYTVNCQNPASGGIVNSGGGSGECGESYCNGGISEGTISTWKIPVGNPGAGTGLSGGGASYGNGVTTNTAAAANSGGGGGGGYNSSAAVNGGNGGSGYVIIYYKN